VFGWSTPSANLQRPGPANAPKIQVRSDATGRWKGLPLTAGLNATIDGPVTRFASSDFAERAFCPVCGSHIWFRDTGSAQIELMPGLFDAAAGWPLRSEIYVDRAMASARLQGDHRRASRADYEEKNRFVPGDMP
jgi:hypothetical protein